MQLLYRLRKGDSAPTVDWRATRKRGRALMRRHAKLKGLDKLTVFPPGLTEVPTSFLYNTPAPPCTDPKLGKCPSFARCERYALICPAYTCYINCKSYKSSQRVPNRRLLDANKDAE